MVWWCETGKRCTAVGLDNIHVTARQTYNSLNIHFGCNLFAFHCHLVLTSLGTARANSYSFELCRRGIYSKRRMAIRATCLQLKYQSECQYLRKLSSRSTWILECLIQLPLKSHVAESALQLPQLSRCWTLSV